MAHKLSELVSMLRSKNAGPFMVGIDIFFDDREKFQMVKSSGVITKDLIARLYKQSPEDVEIYYHDLAMGIKVSFPKNIPTGFPGTRDVDGNQFYVPLRDLEIP